MVEAVPAKKRLARFTPWVNRLELSEAELAKVPDVRQTVRKVEFRGNESQPYAKHFDCRTVQARVVVTKGYAERRKRDPIFDAFGIGDDAEAIRGNANITMLHRDNVWHPYFEIQTEEEDLGTRMRNKQAERKGADVEGSEIAELKASVQNLEKNQREEAEARESASVSQPKKRTFDLKAIVAEATAKE